MPAVLLAWEGEWLHAPGALASQLAAARLSPGRLLAPRPVGSYVLRLRPSTSNKQDLAC